MQNSLPFKIKQKSKFCQNGAYNYIALTWHMKWGRKMVGCNKWVCIWNSANFAFLPLFQIVCTNPLLPNYCFEEVHVTVIESVLNGSQLTSSTTEPASYADYPSPKTETAHSVDGSDSMHDPYNCNVTQDDLYMHKEGGDYGCSPGNKIPQPNTALFAIILTFGTFFISFFLRIFRSSRFLGRTVSIFLITNFSRKFVTLNIFLCKSL